MPAPPQVWRRIPPAASAAPACRPPAAALQPSDRDTPAPPPSPPAASLADALFEAELKKYDDLVAEVRVFYSLPAPLAIGCDVSECGARGRGLHHPLPTHSPCPPPLLPGGHQRLEIQPAAGRGGQGAVHLQVGLRLRRVAARLRGEAAAAARAALWVLLLPRLVLLLPLLLRGQGPSRRQAPGARPRTASDLAQPPCLPFPPPFRSPALPCRAPPRASSPACAPTRS